MCFVDFFLACFVLAMCYCYRLVNQREDVGILATLLKVSDLATTSFSGTVFSLHTVWASPCTLAFVNLGWDLHCTA